MYVSVFNAISNIESYNKICEFACQFYKNSYVQHRKDLENDSSDLDQSDPYDYHMVSRKQKMFKQCWIQHRWFTELGYSC